MPPLRLPHIQVDVVGSLLERPHTSLLTRLTCNKAGPLNELAAPAGNVEPEFTLLPGQSTLFFGENADGALSWVRRGVHTHNHNLWICVLAMQKRSVS